MRVSKAGVSGTGAGLRTRVLSLLRGQAVEWGGLNTSQLPPGARLGVVLWAPTRDGRWE